MCNHLFTTLQCDTSPMQDGVYIYCGLEYQEYIKDTYSKVYTQQEGKK